MTDDLNLDCLTISTLECQSSDFQKMQVTPPPHLCPHDLSNEFMAEVSTFEREFYFHDRVVVVRADDQLVELPQTQRPLGFSSCRFECSS